VFDCVVIVDWSASAVPKRGADSIWVAALDAATGACSLENLRTRALAEARLLALASSPGRSLVGFDFPFGYPMGFAGQLGLEGTPWAATWALLAEMVHDDEHNHNNRFAVAAELNRRLGSPHFWGVPSAREAEWLPVRRPAEALARWRLAEQRLRDGGLRPFSVWQLLGAGSVGSQALTGIPVVHRLRHHPLLRDRSAVWPFETGLALGDTPDVVFAEVWPSAIAFDHVDHPVKDARQVIALAHHLASATAVEPTLTDAARCAVMAEEGWVLGVG
jgi:precorrin-8X/cobalt-precorrin-8 methylmutase